jgi:hypothetical protein
MRSASAPGIARSLALPNGGGLPFGRRRVLATLRRRAARSRSGAGAHGVPGPPPGPPRSSGPQSLGAGLLDRRSTAGVVDRRRRLPRHQVALSDGCDHRPVQRPELIERMWTAGGARRAVSSVRTRIGRVGRVSHWACREDSRVYVRRSRSDWGRHACEGGYVHGSQGH